MAALAQAATRLAFKLPAPLLSAATGGRPRPVDGMRLDPTIAALLAARARLGAPSLNSLSPEKARAEYRRQYRAFRGPPRRVRAVTDTTVPGPAGAVPIRLYEPVTAARPAPLCVFYHGGGGVIGDLDAADGPCRFLADEAGVSIASVDYRLAPEHPFPAGVEDALAAYAALAARAADFGADPARVAVAGDSVGGSFAATVARAFARDSLRPKFQLLFYPGVDLEGSHPSRHTFAEGYLLTRPLMDWFRGHYLPDPELAADPRASPLRAPDLSGAPPALVATAGHDPLRDEGRAYADRLEAAGASVRYECFEGLIHAFLSAVDLIGAATAAARECARALGAALRAL